VPYGFSKDEFFFNENDIKTIIQIVNKFKEKDIKINHNFDYIINEFNEVKK
jgi:hypothetical protein